MTPFEKWCEENGFDPKGEFVVVKYAISVEKGSVLTIKRDDATYAPLFNTSNGRDHYVSLSCLTQHKTEPKMTEQKLPIPRMVEVRGEEDEEWEDQELLADMSELGVDYPFICRNDNDSTTFLKWKYMREIPQPKTRPMTPRELLDAIRGGAVWRYEGGESVCAYWYSEMHQNIAKELCYDWHGTDSDIWVKAEVTE